MIYEVDSYKLEYNEKTNQYFIYFKDSIGKDCKIEIDEKVFEVYMKSRKEYIKIKNQYTKYEEHSELTELTLYNRSFKVSESIEDIVIQKQIMNDFEKIINEVKKPHNKRLKMYLFDDMTIQEIAKKENKSERTIRYSLTKGLTETRKKLKNLINFTKTFPKSTSK